MNAAQITSYGQNQCASFRSFIKEIVFAIARHWSNSVQAKQTLKDNLIVFKDGIFPQLFQWTMSPIVTLQKNMYAVAQEEANNPAKKAFWTEID